MGEAFDDGGGDKRRVGSVAPYALERRVAGPEVLALDDEDVPFHDVLRPSTRCGQGRANIEQDLFRLRTKIAGPNDLPARVDRVLAADVDRSNAARDHRDIAECRVLGQSIRIEELHLPKPTTRCICHHSLLSLVRRRWAATLARLPQRSIEHQRRCPYRDVSTNSSAQRDPSHRLSRAARGPPRRSTASRAVDDKRLCAPCALTHVRLEPGSSCGTRHGCAARSFRTSRAASGTGRPSIIASDALQIAACSRAAISRSSAVACRPATPTTSAAQRSRSDGRLSDWNLASGPACPPGPVTARAIARLPGSKVKT